MLTKQSKEHIQGRREGSQFFFPIWVPPGGTVVCLLKLAFRGERKKEREGERERVVGRDLLPEILPKARGLEVPIQCQRSYGVIPYLMAVSKGERQRSG